MQQAERGASRVSGRSPDQGGAGTAGAARPWAQPPTLYRFFTAFVVDGGVTPRYLRLRSR